MAGYQFNEIEKKWQQYWEQNETFKASVDTNKPKYYSLDMFPYPSGAGLHVGHPLGYIASDIISRYKRIKGFNVLHPMGFDAFGLPAEQYAIQTGQHPAITTKENIARYKEQLKNIGFSFDWDKEVQTCDPSYYKWTQWIFTKLFDSWYNYDTDKAQHIETLVSFFEKDGNIKVNAACDADVTLFTLEEWKGYSKKEKSDILLQYRLTYLAETSVNWCSKLGTVLSNDEVKDGFSEREGHPVVRKNMMQWSMRMTAYAERLLQGLDKIDWPEPLKDMQRNWIGKSIGAEVTFKAGKIDIPVFTTRIDTIYGVTYLAVAPESDFVDQLTTDDQKQVVDEYVSVAKNRSERDRMSDVKNISGVFTGSYAVHPYTGENVQVWVADYVLAGYGTGAVMAVPSGDQRDYDFAKHFGLPIVPVYDEQIIEEQADPTKEGKMINSGILNGLGYDQAIKKAINFAEEKGVGTGKINYRIRDAVFARQRYWGEPVPVYFDNGIPKLVDVKDLPIVLPEIDKYLPTEDGDPPLGRAEDFTYTPSGSTKRYPLELSTMPGWAGSSWYWFRYMEANNDNEFVSQEAQEYWQAVDLYIGGSEHATGHLLYSRFWCKFLYDMGLVQEDEPFKKLINQGMIQGRSNFVYRLNVVFITSEMDSKVHTPEIFVSKNLMVKFKNSNVSNQLISKIRSEIEEEVSIYNKKMSTNVRVGGVDFTAFSKFHIDVNIVENDILNEKKFRKWRKSYANSIIISEEDGKYICGAEVEKMSKSKYNVVNPDDIVSKYGADTLRLYEMFLGPLEQFKPWNINGIDGVYKFLGKMWNLFHDENGKLKISEDAASKEEQKSIHKTIKKVQEGIERYSFNTPVSAFMICVNELTTLKCNKREILEPLTLIVSPYAPHIAEELWKLLGHEEGISQAEYPTYDQTYLKEDVHEYPVSINGKMRVKIKFPFDMPKAEIEKEVLASEVVQKWIESKTPKKVIIIPNKIVNIVV